MLERSISVTLGPSREAAVSVCRQQRSSRCYVGFKRTIGEAIRDQQHGHTPPVGIFNECVGRPLEQPPLGVTTLTTNCPEMSKRISSGLLEVGEF